MKKTMKLMAILIVLAMLVSLAACGSAETSDASEISSAEEDSIEVSSPEETEAVATDESAEAVPDDSSAQEESVVEESSTETTDTYTGAVSAEDSTITYPLEEDSVTLTFWHPFSSTMPGVYDTITDISTVNYISEQVGVEIEWTTVSGSEMFSSFNLMAAAGDYCDMIEAAVECYSGGAIGALDDGVIIDLTDYIEENCPEYLAAFEARGALSDIITSDGRYACLYGAYEDLYNSQGYVIRQDWLDELGLDTPITYDDYYNVLCAFKDAYNCTEAFMMDETCQDEYHTSGGYGTPGYKSGNFGTGSDLYVVDGMICSSFNSTGYHDYLAEMNKWYEAGLFTADFATLSSQPNSDDRAQLIASENSGIWYTGATSIDGQAETIGNSDAVVTGIADPVLAEGEINHFSSASYVNTQCDVSVSATCENIEAALQYLNYYFTDEGIMLYNYGIEGETYNLVDNEVVYTDLILEPTTGYTSFTTTEAYVMVGMVCSVTSTHRAEAFYSDITVETLELWNATQDNEYVIPSGVSLTAEESSQVSAIQSDLYTYVATAIPQFILGELDIESDWDDFVATCESMNLQGLLDIYQAAYDRYMA